MNTKIENRMKKLNKRISKKTLLLVESILDKDPLTANKIFPTLVAEQQLYRELEALNIISEEDDDLGGDDLGGDDLGGDDLGGDESGEEESSDESGDDLGGDESGEEESSDESGDESGEEDSDESPSDDETSEILNDTIEIQCQINAKVISNLFDIIANIKKDLAAKELDENSKEFIILDTPLAYYSDKLQEFQTKTNPGTDQTKIEEALDKITTALEELKSKVQNDSSDLSSGDDLDSEGETSDESDNEDFGSDEESSDEESSDDTESSDDLGSDESSDDLGSDEESPEEESSDEESDDLGEL